MLRSYMRCGFAALVAAGLAGTAEVRAELLGQGEYSFGEVGTSEGAFPKKLPVEAPDQVFRGNGDFEVQYDAGTLGFEPHRDTTIFGNNGRCYGQALTTALWFKQMVAPFTGGAELGERARLALDRGIPAPSREQVRANRLRDFTSREEGFVRGARLVELMNGDQQRGTMNGSFDHAVVQRAIDADMARERGRMAMLMFRTPNRENWWQRNVQGVTRGGAEHALLVYKSERGTIRGGGGRAVRAIRYRFYDPNFPPADADVDGTRGQYLIWFEAARKLGFAEGGWMDTYRGNQGWMTQTAGETFFGGLMGTVGIHSDADMAARATWFAGRADGQFTQDAQWYKDQFNYAGFLGGGQPTGPRDMQGGAGGEPGGPRADAGGLVPAIPLPERIDAAVEGPGEGIGVEVGAEAGAGELDPGAE